MSVFILMIIMNINSLLKNWKNENKDLSNEIATYVKKEPPYTADYVDALLILDMLSEVDSTEKPLMYEALHSNFMGNCRYSEDFPDELKFFSLRCYLEKNRTKEAEGILKQIHKSWVRCLGGFRVGVYYYSHGEKSTGKDFLVKSIKNCKDGIVPLWSRDVLFSK